MGIYVSPVILVIAGIVFIYLLYKMYELNHKAQKPDIRYVDTSGIQKNPSEFFIDVWKNKTINFELGKYKIKICHFPVLKGLDYIGIIASLYQILINQLEFKSTKKLEIIQNRAVTYNIYIQIVNMIYVLSKPFVNKQLGFKKTLFKKAKEDSDFIINISEEIFDYWLGKKKRLQLLAHQTTLRQTVGEYYTRNSLETDIRGRILIKPRYVPLSNIHNN